MLVCVYSTLKLIYIMIQYVFSNVYEIICIISLLYIKGLHRLANMFGTQLPYKEVFVVRYTRLRSK